MINKQGTQIFVVRELISNTLLMYSTHKKSISSVYTDDIQYADIILISPVTLSDVIVDATLIVNKNN